MKVDISIDNTQDKDIYEEIDENDPDVSISGFRLWLLDN